MKKYERLIIYSIVIFASVYGIWAHGKLQRIYRINRNAKIPSTELLVPGYEKIKNIELPSTIALYDYEFEEDHDDKRDGHTKIIWHAWYFNSYPYPVRGYYNIEFRNHNNSLLVALDPIPATLVPTGKSSGGLPREQNGIYWMPNGIFRQAAYSKSRINLIEKK